MSEVSRRTFVSHSAGLLTIGGSLWGVPLHASNLGVQLYTVRNVIGKDTAGVLKKIEEIGYKEVEATSSTLDQISSALNQTSLKPVSIHVDNALFFEGGSKLADAFDQAKQSGFQYVVMPYVPPEKRGGVEVFKKLAETLNKAGEQAKSNGLTLAYHNHAFEFEPLGETTGLQVLLKETHKDLLQLEMDMFWVSVAGQNPVDLLKTYSGRVPLLHVKDKKAGIATQFNEKVPKDTFKEAGNGSIDLPAVLAAANKAGVKHYFVEQDQTAGDPLDSLRQSYKYLSSQFKT